MSTKSVQSNSHGSKSIPDGRVTKLITQADTLNTEILTLLTSRLQKSKNLDKDLRFKQNNKGEDQRSCYDNPELIRNPYITKLFFTACPKQENLKLI